MDFTENIIQKVRKHRCLYDKDDKKFKNFRHKQQIWESIANELNQPAAKVKSKWKNLRDGYIRYAKLSATDKKIVNYVWTEQLTFLKGLATPRRKNSNVVVKDECDSSDEDALQDDPFVREESHEIVVKTDDESETGPQCSYKRMELSEDDDYMFFKSLLPYMRGLPPLRKLMIRSKIHEILIQELSNI